MNAILSNALTVQTGGASPAASGASGSSGTGSAAGSTGDGVFAGLLVQHVNAGETAASDPLLASLAALLQGLPLPMLADIAAAAQAEDGSMENGMRLLQAMAVNPGVMERLASNPQMGAWLAKANELLAAFGNGDAAAQAQQALTDANPTLAAPQTEQASEQIVARLLATVQKHPESVLMRQLVQDFASVAGPMLAVTTQGEQRLPANVQGNKTAEHSAQVLSDESAGPLRAAAPHSPKYVAADAPNVVSQEETASNEPQTGRVSALQMLQSKAVLAGWAMQEKRSDVSAESGTDAAQPVTEAAQTSTASAPMSAQDLLRFGQPAAGKPVQDTVNEQNFVQDMSQFMLKTMKVNVQGTFSEARLSLTPEHLGHVDVTITMQNGQLVAHFAAQTAAGKELLEGQLASLRQTLQNQGLQVERLEVTQNGSLASGMFQDQGRQPQSQQFARQDKGKLAEYDGSHDFSEEMAAIAELRSAAYGSGFDVTA